MATVDQNEHGNLVLIDPECVAVARAVGKHNCKATLEMNADRVTHFRNRATERGDSDNDILIVLANVDDRNGAELASMLMPGHDWQQYRDRGEIPFARGLAGREGVQSFLEIVDTEAAKKLKASEGLAVVVVDHGVAEVF